VPVRLVGVPMSRSPPPLHPCSVTRQRHKACLVTLQALWALREAGSSPAVRWEASTCVSPDSRRVAGTGVRLRLSAAGCRGGSGRLADDAGQPQLLGKALVIRGGGDKDVLDDDSIRAALRILNATLADMESARVQGLCGVHVPERTCMSCGSTNVRLGVTWRGISEIGMGALDQGVSGGVRGVPVGPTGGRGIGPSSFNGEVHDLWAVFMCRRCAVGMAWDMHPSCFTTSKRCRFCVRRSSYGADGGQMRHCRRHRAPGRS